MKSESRKTGVHPVRLPAEPRIPWPDPDGDMLNDPLFNAIWRTIQEWDINVPRAYAGYCGATGNHARAILEAVRKVGNDKTQTVKLRLRDIERKLKEATDRSACHGRGPCETPLWHDRCVERNALRWFLGLPWAPFNTGDQTNELGNL